MMPVFVDHRLKCDKLVVSCSKCFHKNDTSSIVSYLLVALQEYALGIIERRSLCMIHKKYRKVISLRSLPSAFPSSLAR